MANFDGILHTERGSRDLRFDVPGLLAAMFTAPMGYVLQIAPYAKAKSMYDTVPY